jgi:hypothetical protein
MEKKVNLKKQSQSRLAPNTAGGLLTDLKKQSQFSLNLMGVKPFVKGGYDDNPLCEEDENKAKQACAEPVERGQLGIAGPVNGAGKSQDMART